MKSDESSQREALTLVLWPSRRVRRKACAKARGVVEEDFAGKNAQFTNPKLTAQTMGWATKILVI